MDQLRNLPRNIPDVIPPTFAIFGDLLRQPGPATAIRAVNRETHSYGSHSRHVLDVYKPSASAPPVSSNASRPLLLFVYGGGFVTGGRVLSTMDELVYCNLGYFMAEKLGYETIVMDYKLLQHGATFPDGPRDIDTALEWMAKNLTSEDGQQRELIILGNSAGGVNVASWSFLSGFASSVDKLVRGDEGLRLKSIVILGGPFVWDSRAGVAEILKAYYGSEQAAAEKSPLPLMQGLFNNETNPAKWPYILVAVSELDPDFVIDTSKEFIEHWMALGGSGAFWQLEKHNHISPPLALGTGDPEAEAWGYELGSRLAKVGA